jgi:5'-nucleotidase
VKYLGFFALTLALGCGSSESNPSATDTGVITDSTADTPEETSVTPQGSADVTLLTLTSWQGQLEPLTVTVDKTATTYGGLGLLSTYFKEERAAAKGDVLLVTAGDEFGATPVLSSAFDDEPTVKGLEFLGLKATTFGNHNFDLGIARLKAIIDTAGYHFVTSNLTNVKSELGAKVDQPMWMTEVGTSTPKAKVAFIGLSAPSLLSIQFPGKFGSIGIEDPINAGKSAVTAARAGGASLVVALVHVGADSVDATGAPTGPLADLVKAVPGVDVWVGDHTDVKVNATLNGALVVQNHKRGRGYAVVNVKIENGKVTAKTATSKEAIGTVVEVVPSGTTCPTTPCGADFTCSAKGACEKLIKAPDPAADKVLEPYTKALPEKFDAKLAVIADEYKRGGTPQIERIGETPLGDLIADALLSKCKPLGAKIALLNGGGLKSGLPSSYAPADKTLRRNVVGYAPGPPYDLVLGDIFNMHPYANAAVIRKVRGSVLWTALENGFSLLPAANGGFPQIAGFTVVYDAAAPTGSRVVSVTLDDGTVVPKDDAKEIVLATVDFVNAGGDGYAMLVEAVPSPTLDLLTTIVAEYLKASSPVAAPKGGRLVPKM